MSIEAMAHVWNVAGVTAEERLALIWLASSSGGLGYPICPEWIALGEFICTNHKRACETIYSLIGKGLVRQGNQEEETAHCFWIEYDGPYHPPIDWTRETKRRSRRVAALIERDGPECQYCGAVPVNYHVDHFMPRARNGADKLHNLVLACAKCNQAKRDKHPSEFLRDRPQLYHAIITNLKCLHE